MRKPRSRSIRGVKRSEALSASITGAPVREPLQLGAKGLDLVEQLERERDARRVEVEVAREPRRDARATQRHPGEAPLLRRLALGLEHAFADPAGDPVLGHAQARLSSTSVMRISSSTTAPPRPASGSSCRSSSSSPINGAGRSPGRLSPARDTPLRPSLAGRRQHDREDNIEVAGRLARQAAACRRSLRPAAEPAGMVSWTVPSGVGARRSRRARPPRARAAGRRRRRGRRRESADAG